MTFTSVEIIALILIVFSAIKIIVLLISPISWMNFAKGIYKNPKLMQFIAFILAAVVLYYLVDAGITIVQIFAVTAFVAFLVLMGLATEFDHFIKKSQAMIKKGTLWKQYWLYSLIWVALLIWGIKELFF